MGCYQHRKILLFANYNFDKVSKEVQTKRKKMNSHNDFKHLLHSWPHCKPFLLSSLGQCFQSCIWFHSPHAFDICTEDMSNSTRSPFQLIHILWGCQPLFLSPLLYSPSFQAKSQRASEIKAEVLSPLKEREGETQKHSEKDWILMWFILPISPHQLFLSLSCYSCLK